MLVQKAEATGKISKRARVISEGKTKPHINLRLLARADLLPASTSASIPGSL
jgi:hypothetical protein